MFGRNVSTASQEVRRNTWIGNGVLDSFLEDESLFGEFLRAPVSGDVSGRPSSASDLMSFVPHRTV